MPSVDGAALQGEAHVRAAIVDGVYLVALGKERQRVAVDLHRQAALGLDLCQSGDPHVTGVWLWTWVKLLLRDRYGRPTPPP